MPRVTRAKTRASKRGVFKWPDLKTESLISSPFYLPVFSDTKTRKLQENAQLRVALLMSKQQDVAKEPKVKPAKLPSEAASSLPLQSGSNANRDECLFRLKIVDEDDQRAVYSLSTSPLPPRSSTNSTTGVVVSSNQQMPLMKSPPPPSARTAVSQINQDAHRTMLETKNRCPTLPAHSSSEKIPAAVIESHKFMQFPPDTSFDKLICFPFPQAKNNRYIGSGC